MTQPTDPLHEPLRLLRETSLAAGFEERLAERLERVHREGSVVRHRFGGHRRTLLLLAAIAFPAAAFASGGWLLEHRRASSSPSVEATRQAKALPKVTRKPFSLPQSVTPPQPPLVDELRASEQANRPGELTREMPVDPKTQGIRGSVRAPNTTRARDAKRASAALPSTPAGQAPAKIESLDVSIRHSERAKGSERSGTERLTGNSLGLRKSSEQGANRSSVERERTGTRRESAGEHRGNDAAQHARERVQARERKGQ